MNSGNFENMIKKYSDELIKMNKEKAIPDPKEEIFPVMEEPVNARSEAESLNEFTEEMSSSAPEEDAEFTEETQEEPALFENPQEEAPDSFAYFSARVFTGTDAYPVKNAKVIITRDDKLFTYLVTDSDGKTKKIKLPSYPESNSLDPDSTQQELDYKGEVYAVGFTPKKDLLISAVGGSDILLSVQLSPVDERVK